MWPKEGWGAVRGVKAGFKEKQRRERCCAGNHPERSWKTDIPCLRTHPPRSLSPRIVSHTECAAAGRHSKLRTWPPSFSAEKSAVRNHSRIKSALHLNWMNRHFPPIKDCSFNLNRLWTPTGDEGRVSANRDESSSQVIGRQIGPAKPLNAGGGRRTGVFVWSPWVCLRVCFPAEILRGHISKVVIRYAPMQGGCVQGLRARA